MNDMNNDMNLSVRASNTLKDTSTARQFKSKSDHGRSFITVTLPMLAEGINDLRTATSRMVKAPLYVTAVADIDAEVVALITLVVCLDSLAEPMNKLTLAKRVAEYLLQEINYATLDAANPGLIEGIQKHRKQSHRARMCIDAAVEGGEFGSPSLVEWELPTKYAVGSILLELMAKLDMLQGIKTSRSRVDRYTWSDEVSLWANDTYVRKLYLSPAYLPLIEEPTPYVISCNVTSRELEYKNHSYGPTFPPVDFYLGSNYSSDKAQLIYAGNNLDAADALSRVPYELNGPVYEVMRQLWQQGHAVGNLPSSQPIELPLYPVGGDDEEIAAWKSTASRLHIENAVSTGQRLYTQRQLAIVGGFLDKPLYFLWQADSRGRLYPTATTSLLNPQGSDLAKGLLKFHSSKAKSLGVQGHRALMIACASHYGIDKVSLDKRVEWATENYNMIREVASRPMEVRELWSQADSPFQFLAACMELTAASECTNPTDYVSSYICYQDGKCSGAQHWAALLKDADVGRSVGLTPSTPSSAPPDLYTEVLISTMVALNTSATIGAALNEPPTTVPTSGKSDNIEEYHRWWADIATQGKLTRKAVKPPTMTYVYGSGRIAWSQQLYDWAKESGLQGQPITITKDNGNEYETNDLYKRCVYLAGIISDVLDVRLSAAVVGMKWIKACAKAITKEGYGKIRWSTPQGFEVQQAYRKLTSKRLDIVSKALNVRVRQSMQVTTSEVDKAKQASALAPNYIHSMDAAHLVSVVMVMDSMDYPLTVIHDSFGCLAADTTDMLRVVSTRWAAQYSIDNLAKLKAQWEHRYPYARLPELPEYGGLDEGDVFKSAYAFSP